MTGLSLRELARQLGGEVAGGQVICPGPGHSARDRSLSVRPDLAAPDGFVVFSHCGDDFRACHDHVRQRLGLPAASRRGGGRWTPRIVPPDVNVAGIRQATAL